MVLFQDQNPQGISFTVVRDTDTLTLKLRYGIFLEFGNGSIRGATRTTNEVLKHVRVKLQLNHIHKLL